ncbi:MAG: M23 family metallopeptidase, partial [Thermoanaerobaculia bacterium]
PRAKFRKIRIPLPVLWCSIGLIVFAFLSSLFLSVNFFFSLQKNVQLKVLKEKNKELKKTVDNYKVHLAELEKKLLDLDAKTETLALLSGLETVEQGSSGGVGGVSYPQNLDRDRFVFEWKDKLSRRVDLLSQKWEEKKAVLKIMPTILPTKGIPTAGFGLRSNPFGQGAEFHTGIDISCPSGSPVYASADGMVVEADYSGGLGKCITLFHGLGISTKYGHLSKIVVREGQKIKRGTLIGYTGSTGRSTGPHLHYEVLLNGKPVNPLEYIQESFF